MNAYGTLYDGENKNNMDIQEINKKLQHQPPEEVVAWALQQAGKACITTNFRPYEGAILHLVTQIMPDIDVIWCDTGYNTPETYRHAKELIDRLQLNIHIYVPKQSVGYRNITLGIPEVNSPKHSIFSKQVKLEPFRRAMEEHQPDVWFTNLRKGQTEFRNAIDIVSKTKDGILKISPFYSYSDADLDMYLKKYDLPNENKYYDPTKALANRECGIHL